MTGSFRDSARPVDVKWIALCGAVIAAVTLFAYWPSFRADFVLLDDAAYITHNDMVKKGLTAETFQWAWRENLAGNWHPLTLLSHMLDVSVFGLDARGHHAVNIAFHVCNALLVLILFHRMTGSLWPSALLALLFAVHPVRTESVAWVSERKDVLSTFFALVAMLSYVSYARRPRRNMYIVIAVALLLSLLSKAMFVTLPFLLLLLDVWPLGRWRSGWLGRRQSDADDDEPRFAIASPGRLILEKVPLLVMCAAISVIAWLTQSRTGATEILGMTMPERLVNVVVSYARYLGLTFWPTGLTFFYEHPGMWPATVVLGSAAIVLVITAFALAMFRKAPWALIGWLWFLGTLVPVIGLVQIGRHSIADRYLYFPQLGILVAVVWSMWMLAKRIDATTMNVATERMTIAMLGVLGLGLAFVTQAQASVWRNTDALYGHALSVNPDNVLVLNLYSHYLLDKGRQQEAVELMLRAAKLSPNRADEELAMFERELRISPNKPENMNNVAWYLATHYDAGKRNGARALELALQANELSGYREPLHLDTLAAAYAELGNFDEAVKMAQRARDLARESGRQTIIPEIENRLRHYQAGKPFRLPQFN